MPGEGKWKIADEGRWGRTDTPRREDETDFQSNAPSSPVVKNTFSDGPEAWDVYAHTVKEYFVFGFRFS